jgi:hypothetical protein
MPDPITSVAQQPESAPQPAPGANGTPPPETPPASPVPGPAPAQFSSAVPRLTPDILAAILRKIEEQLRAVGCRAEIQNVQAVLPFLGNGRRAEVGNHVAMSAHEIVANLARQLDSRLARGGGAAALRDAVAALTPGEVSRLCRLLEVEYQEACPRNPVPGKYRPNRKDLDRAYEAMGTYVSFISALQELFGTQCAGPVVAYPELLEWAEKELRGKERRVVELAAAKGTYPLRDMAVDAAISWGPDWHHPWDGARRRINHKLSRDCKPHRLVRRGGNAVVQPTVENPS